MHVRASSHEYNNCVNWKYIILSIHPPPEEQVPLLTFVANNLEKEASSDGKEKIHLTKRSILSEFDASPDDSDGETLSSIKRIAQINSSTSVDAFFQLKKKIKKVLDKKE